MAKRVYLFFLLLSVFCHLRAQQADLTGRVVDPQGEPLEFATVQLPVLNLYAITDLKGNFTIRKVTTGRQTLRVSCLGFVQQELSVSVTRGMRPLRIQLQEENLKLQGVEVVAKRSENSSTTAYTIDRLALDNQQVLNLSDVQSLLPGGKTVNSTLMDDSRIQLHSLSGEKGNNAFGTAVEVDGLRMGNNAQLGETTGASTRSLGTANIQSVEIVTGIPSVEYGDLSNGMVRVRTRRGKSPFIVEGKINQHTRQIALNKGFQLGVGMLNVSLEHARSFSDAASPHTAYQRNILTLGYQNTFMKKSLPLTLTANVMGNVGGFNSEADPDEELDDYTRARDNHLAANVRLDWLLNQPWITDLSLSAGVNYIDEFSTAYYNTNSASTQPYIHSMAEGYAIAQDYDLNPEAPIVLGPTGYWYVKQHLDSKPLELSLKLKANWNRKLGRVNHHLLLGTEFTASHNGGQGTYYADRSYAPTWRPYSYDALPWMRNLALYAEETVTLPTGRLSLLKLTAGLRDDITLISGSDYGTVSSLSPRFNARYVFWQNQRQRFVSGLSVYGGWGKQVKLPSFQVLYPRPAYSDHLAFSSTSDAQNRSYYAYHTFPTAAVYNPDLRWQYAQQTDLGLELQTRLFTLTVSGFYTKTFRSYLPTNVYTPFAYNYTSPTALQQSGIAVGNRRFSVDPHTGLVTVSDASGVKDPVVLEAQERRTYVSNTRYVNASPVSRYGLEWIIDFREISALHTRLRLDGNYYHYESLDETFIADVPAGLSVRGSDGQPFQYIGYYRGSNATSTGYTANASVSNGALHRQVNLNATLTTHLPRLRLIMALRLETSLLNFSRARSEYRNGKRGYVVASAADNFGEVYDGEQRDQTVMVYPDYYSTWAEPDVLIPFAERYAWARDNDRVLYSDLTQLIVRSNYPYTMNPNRLSRYYSVNFSVTKEIGDHVSLSFYANNFFNNMNKIRSTQTGLETTLFGSTYIPKFYYGLSVKLKI